MTPDISRLILFLSIIIVIQGGIDYYVYRILKNVLHEYGIINKNLKIIYSCFAGIMMILLIATTIERLWIGSNMQSGHGIQILIAIWYLPKYPLAIIKGMMDVFALVYGHFNRRKHSMLTSIPSRRKALHTIGITASMIPFIGVIKGLFHTIYDIEVKKVEIVLQKIPRALDGVTIVQISDIHTGSLFDLEYLRKAITLVNEQQPSIITVTGDYVNFDPDELVPFLPILKELKATYGVFGCLGNHDHYMSPDKHDLLKEMIRSTGIDLLINESRILTIHNSQLLLAGTDNTGFNQHFADLSRTFAGQPKQYPSILMSHDPTFWSMEVLSSGLADITLSGHTHGGQFGIEFLGHAYSPAQIMYEHWSGLYTHNDAYLYVNRGLGTVGPPIRMGIPPEITVLTLRSPLA